MYGEYRTEMMIYRAISEEVGVNLEEDLWFEKI
jgi:hypothetical protein